jgi:hypothetical protein
MKLTIRERELEPRKVVRAKSVSVEVTAEARELLTFVIDFTFTRDSPISRIGFLERTAS